MKIDSKITTDVLVVGSGLSGIKVSKELASSKHEVLMVTKTKLASGSSFYPLKASLGTQVTKDADDKELFLQDIEDLSRGMHRQDLAEVYVEEIPDRVTEYKDIGVLSKKLEGERKACFANHPRDIYLLSDWDQIRENVRTIFSEYDNLNLMEKTVVVSLIKKEKRIVGAVMLNEENEFVLVECKAVILASGGFGSLYKHNLNPTDVDGSGHILALEAGASLVNMEFIQFIPGITAPRYKTLFGEHTLMYCQDIINDNGESLLDPYLPEEVTKKECLEIRSSHGPFTHSLESRYFDIAMMKSIIASRDEKGFSLVYDEELYENKEEFYTVYLDWLKGKNVHLTKQEVKIAPFAHASNGGVFIDTHGETGIDGLYAIGELSSNIEGANRLGGNSTGACMVFGKRAATACGKYLQSVDAYDLTEEEGNEQLQKLLDFTNSYESQESELTANQIVDKIKEIMWYHGNVVRSEKQLVAALEEINVLESDFQFEELIEHRHSRKLAIKVRNFIRLSQILLQAMLERKESRGAHYREDFPVESPDFNKRLFVSQNNQHSVSLEFLTK
ncbi:FAD-binding protein [Virgibacillus necropolis]|uniref:L-aspartate oxidase n=1 Tax=Virgibacillus necropolis TaxID=163877 RepID=A0A221MEP6_9BACI|nr:FAD-binding protein [Virgibacillus necropolis]ASN06148.1 succinate dehydrogenase/fumarate reductase flavoprotein subunit [Virgibacillus necropolis]